MTSKNISAEEKLLRLIKGKSKEINKTDNKTLPSEKEKSNLKKTLLQNKIKTLKIKFNKKFFDYSLIVLCLILSLNLLGQFILEKYTPLIKIQDRSQRETQETKTPSVEEKPYTYFTENVDKKELFSASFKSEEEPKKKDTKAIKELIKDISLVGIVLKQDKFVAIIEDKPAQKTYFLSEGDYLDELLIKHIETGKVTLDYEGQEVELYI